MENNSRLASVEHSTFERLAKKLMAPYLPRKFSGKVQIEVEVKPDGSLGKFPRISPIFQANTDDLR